MATVKMTISCGTEEKLEPETEGDDSSQLDNSALEATIDLLERSTIYGGGSGLCSISHHLHSFCSVPFLLLPVYACAGCGEKLQPYVLGGTSSGAAAVKCMACGVYAHRKCAFSKTIKWETKCSSAKQDDCIGVNGDGGQIGSDVSSEEVDDAETLIGATRSQQIILEEILEDSSNTGSHFVPKKNAQESIFRRPSTRTDEMLARQDFSVVRKAASVDNIFKTPKDVQQTRANFPFLSSASLLPSRHTYTNKENLSITMQKCNTWDGVIKVSSPVDEEDQTQCNSALEVKHESDDEDTQREADHRDDDASTSTKDIAHETAAPLYFASHGFQAVSQVLQENIIANFSRLILKEDSTQGKDAHEITDNGGELDSNINDSQSPADPTSKNDEKIPDKTTMDDNNDSEAHSLLETSEPEQNSTMDRKRLGLATVAGSIVGGVVGVGLAGPVGGMIGVKCGQTAGMLGLLLEGSVTASVWASGITVGMAAGQRIQERHETHVLAIGEGTKQRALLMVRPTIQPPEPVWDEIYREAGRSYSDSNSGLVNRLLPTESQAAKRERYEREVDIVETGEDELAISDKVLLLVSRILSNKDSLPGHIYRKLIEAFRNRCREVNLQDLYRTKQDQRRNDVETIETEKNKLSETIGNEDQNEENHLSLMHQRRRDAHAVIKYVTTSLLLTRPGFGHTSSLTEKTATAVESLIFGEIYDLVIEEIEREYQNQDNLLLEKIADFERRQNQGLCSIETPGNCYFGSASYISEAALEALCCLPQTHSAVDKLRYCVVFLEQISEKYSKSAATSSMGADSLLKMVCQHILLAKVIGINCQIAFLEEFARDEQLLRGREGYALVTLQASLHFLNASTNFESDIFGEDSD